MKINCEGIQETRNELSYWAGAGIGFVVVGLLSMFINGYDFIMNGIILAGIACFFLSFGRMVKLKKEQGE